MLRAAACGVFNAEVQTVPLSLCFNAHMTRAFGCSHEGQGVELVYRRCCRTCVNASTESVNVILYVHTIVPYFHKHVPHIYVSWSQHKHHLSYDPP
jgi:hypothetical protein